MAPLPSNATQPCVSMLPTQSQSLSPGEIFELLQLLLMVILPLIGWIVHRVFLQDVSSCHNLSKSSCNGD
jgi:hypothetical protein